MKSFFLAVLMTALVSFAAVADEWSAPVVAGDAPVVAGELSVAASGDEDPRAVKAGDGEQPVKVIETGDGVFVVVTIAEDGEVVPLTADGATLAAVVADDDESPHLDILAGGEMVTAGDCPVVAVDPVHSEISGVDIEFAVKAICATGKISADE